MSITKKKESVPNREYKSSIFTELFQNYPENFLSLYNAIHDTNLTMDEVTITPERIDQTLYHTFYNDVSMMINGKLIVLIEHQSTINENMPLRFLDYVTRIYERIIPGEDRYSRKLQYIPSPEFYVFYNGKAPYPEEKELKLSDAYFINNENPLMELKVKVYNINSSVINEHNKNLNILNKCDILKQYTACIEILRKAYNKYDSKPFNKAINTCINKGYLKDFLKEKSKEGNNMLISEYSYEMDIAIQRRDSYNDGYESGYETGEQTGETKGKINQAEKTVLTGLQMGLSVEQLVKLSGLSGERVIELQETLK